MPATWWRLYDDPLLDDLIGQAFAANTDLRVATANLRRARAVLNEAQGARLPTTNVTGSAVEARQTVATANGPVPFSSEFYRAGLDASYEIDLYGRVGRNIEAARADADAEAAARDAVLISVAAETTRAYADACSAARQRAVASRSLEAADRQFCAYRTPRCRRARFAARCGPCARPAGNHPRRAAGLRGGSPQRAVPPRGADRQAADGGRSACRRLHRAAAVERGDPDG